MVKELVELLKQARREKQISLHDISEQTKIQPHYLEALEAGHFDRFPGEVYLKGALRNYAAAVGLDPQEVLQLYRDLAREDPPEEPAAAPPPPRKALIPPEREEKGPSLLYSIIVLILLVALGGYWFVDHYWPRRGPGQPGGTDDPPGLVEMPEPPETPEPPEPPAPVERTAQIALSPEQPTPGETAFAVRQVEQLELELTCTGRSWIQLRADDREEFSPRIFQRGETITARAEGRIWIRLGYPPGVELRINGLTPAEVEAQRNAHNFLFIRE